MKKYTIWLSFLLLVISGPAALAHPGHRDPATQEQAIVYAREEIARLVGEGDLDESWTQAALQGAVTRQYGKQTEWEVTFSNETARGESKNTLYIFLSHGGEFLAANFTGE